MPAIKSGGRSIRQKFALQQLEKRYEAFKAAKKDKEPWTTAKNGKPRQHPGRSYKEECARMEQEIQNIKNNLSKSVKG